MKTLLHNAVIVLEDTLVDEGAVLVEDGYIRSVCPDGAQADQHHDCRGNLLMPGLVDLHCDVIERDVEIRRGVLVPMELSVREADRRNAACGITTQFHGIAFGHAERGLRDDGLAAELARTLKRERSHLLVDNRILLRCELASPEAADTIAGLVDEGCADMVSFMDHGPGSETYRRVVDVWLSHGCYGPDPALERMRCLAAACERRELPMGSHDDDCLDRLAFLRQMGIGISEFPKTMEVAAEAIRLGLHTVVGGPNAVRGTSHLNWLKAADAVRASVASAICSDYHPTILPQAAFRLFLQGVAELPDIIRRMTLLPARAAGLHDRGAIAPGLRADLTEMALDNAGWTRLVSCWSRGRLVSWFPAVGDIVSAHSSLAHNNLTEPNPEAIRA
jgi:alpha-D-ribose 1-methylphosphonate 5-triphosphate diphosphatase